MKVNISWWFWWLWEKVKGNVWIRKSVTYAQQDWEPLADNFPERTIFILVIAVAGGERGRTAWSLTEAAGGRKELQEWFDSRSLRQLVTACGRVFVSLISAPRASWGRVEMNFLPLGFISPSRWCFMIVNSIFRISVNRKDTVLKIKKRKSSNWSLIRAALRWF